MIGAITRLCKAARAYGFSGTKTKNKLSDRMIKQLLNSVIAKYRDLSVSRRSIICLSLRLRQITDLHATDKSRYFAQPRPIIVKYLPIRSRGKYSPILAEPEANNCFSLIFSGEYQESAKQRAKTR